MKTKMKIKTKLKWKRNENKMKIKLENEKMKMSRRKKKKKPVGFFNAHELSVLALLHLDFIPFERLDYVEGVTIGEEVDFHVLLLSFILHLDYKRLKLQKNAQ